MPEVAPAAARPLVPVENPKTPERARALEALPGDDEEGHTVSS
jgi:hypothetical protein